MKTVTKIIIIALAATAFVSTACSEKNGFTREERVIIGADASSVMRLWLVTNPDDSLLLRAEAFDLNDDDIRSSEFHVLCGRMLATVNDPLNPGVGIAAPQVGISRRLIAVQRFDREGYPFGFYANPVIVEYGSEKEPGREGCLSVPDTEGYVNRATTITLEYTDAASLERVREVVTGFTAVIFQHEIDHLDGIIFTDRLERDIEITGSII